MESDYASIRFYGDLAGLAWDTERTGASVGFDHQVRAGRRDRSER